ncbi:MAG TPA: LamG-like jellyroll fold domain-containing protein [Sedimentisphaerales bacterium]|nr:LamG-like jellyroll fold domain-containing protein [Sedimentisphaerales bacterium]
MYRIAILIVVGLAVLGTGDAKGTIIEFHTDGIIQHGDDFDFVEIFDGATVVMVGGAVRDFRTYETSALNIWGGTVEWGSVLGYDSSIINVGGGILDVDFLGGFDSSTVNISGGSFTGRIGVEDSSQMNIWGGIQNTVLTAFHSSVVNIYGENFEVTPSGSSFFLTGNWADGEIFDMYLRGPDTFPRVNLIPEPATFALLGLGVFGLIGKRRRPKRLLYVVSFLSLVFLQVAEAGDPSEQVLHMGSPVSFGEFDAGGYADWCWWGPSARHGYEYHEMLSGEWAGAIYYNGIATGDQAMWLTDKFIYPDWLNPDNDFTVTSCSSWDDPSPPGNPVPPNYNAKDHANNTVTAYDTGQSVIQNGQVRITIDYEMVDLGEQVPGSPMAFGSLVGADAFVYSERYILLQTYTITNITASSLEDLQFYQMLHGHPADEGNAVVYSVYDDADHEDPLESYVPYNQVHTVGNFRYDITQWNNFDDPDKHPLVTHRDWIGFSSTVPPDFIENGYYEGHDAGKPPRDPDPDLTGTHWNIEDRNLNEKPYRFGEAAGAMGWSLGTLAPADSVKLTLAIMFGAGPIQKTCEQIEPVAHWGLDEGSAEIAHDSIGDNDGTLVGDPEWVAGEYIGGALEFDGDEDYVSLSDPVGVLMGDSVTISAWVKPGLGMVSGRFYDIFSQSKWLSSFLFGYELYLEIGADGLCRPGFSLKYPESYARSDDAIAGSEWSEWAWVVGTNDGTNLKVYVNGELKKSAGSTGRMGVYSDAYIGYLPTDPPFIGVIDCVRVFACAWDPSQDCLQACHQDYDEWFEAGRPACWCTPYQCDGDAWGNPYLTTGWRVYTDDLDILAANWKKKDADPCADVSHKPYLTTGWRVYTDDLGILAANWKRKDFPDLPADCAVRGCGEAARGSGTSEQVTSKELLDWLAEMWLDPEVRERIEAEAWLKLYESLKE